MIGSSRSEDRHRHVAPEGQRLPVVLEADDHPGVDPDETSRRSDGHFELHPLIRFRHGGGHGPLRIVLVEAVSRERHTPGGGLSNPGGQLVLSAGFQPVDHAADDLGPAAIGR